MKRVASLASTVRLVVKQAANQPAKLAKDAKLVVKAGVRQHVKHANLVAR